MKSSVTLLAMCLASVAAGQDLTTGTKPDPGQHGRPLRSDRFGLLEVNPQFFELAAGTGGDFYFWAPGEFARAGLQLPIHGDPVLLAYGVADGPSRSFAIPVEHGARSLTVFAGAQRKDRAVLVRPNGSIVADASSGARLQSFSHMLIATIDSPTAGNWRLELAGAGKYSVSAHVSASSDGNAPALIDFDFVELGGRPAHEGWFPITRELRKGELIECSARVSGGPISVQFAFVSGDERPISMVPMERTEGEGNYFGRCLIPGLPFRIVVSGQDSRGLPFRRIDSALRTPQ